MPTYVYENARGERFEFEQRMAAAPLTAHPETGEAIRRVPALVSVIGTADVPSCGPGGCAPAPQMCGLPQCGTGGCQFN
jgi:hypothetical protein